MLRRAFVVNCRSAPSRPSASHAIRPSRSQVSQLLHRTRGPRPFHAGPAQRSSQRSQSSNSFVLAAVGAACASAAVSLVLYDAVAPRAPAPGDLEAEAPPPAASAAADAAAAMTTTELLPGRPGNLTPEELVKLQEFWKATMKVAGVESGGGDGDGDGVGLPGDDLRNGMVLEDDEDADTVSVANSKMDGSIRTKSKRRSVFGRKSREGTPKKSSIKSGSGDSAGASATESDKYGQTKEFFKALASNTPEQIRAALWSMTKADHPDALLLRFLRARKWDVDKALVMMVSTLHWRLHEIRVDDDVMFRGEEQMVIETASDDKAVKKHASDVMSQFRRGKSYIHGLDREGRPMCFIRVKLHRIGEAGEAALDRFTVYLIETARLMVVPPVDTAAIIFDMSGFSLANMDYAPIKFMIKVFEANYPESLGVVLVHKAPWLFQGIWRIIRGWLDPVVASKIHFTSNNTDLEGYIARDRIPKEMGGDEDWEYSYPEPVPGENDRMKDTAARDRLQQERDGLARQYEELTRDWVRGPAGDPDVMAERNAVAAKLRRNYWRMDPYIRARSLYDRVGMIREGGELDFYGEYDDEEDEWADALEYQPGEQSNHAATNGAAAAPRVNGVK